jgi:hypothetical protein
MTDTPIGGRRVRDRRLGARRRGERPTMPPHVANVWLGIAIGAGVMGSVWLALTLLAPWLP